jgi:hypothetical protein
MLTPVHHHHTMHHHHEMHHHLPHGGETPPSDAKTKAILAAMGIGLASGPVVGPILVGGAAVSGAALLIRRALSR